MNGKRKSRVRVSGAAASYSGRIGFVSQRGYIGRYFVALVSPSRQLLWKYLKPHPSTSFLIHYSPAKISLPSDVKGVKYRRLIWDTDIVKYVNKRKTRRGMRFKPFTRVKNLVQGQWNLTCFVVNFLNWLPDIMNIILAPHVVPRVAYVTSEWRCEQEATVSISW
jgi:hypothetical protein